MTLPNAARLAKQMVSAHDTPEDEGLEFTDIAFDDAVAEALAGGPVLVEETLIELTRLYRIAIRAAAIAAGQPIEGMSSVVMQLYEDWYEQGQPPQVT